MLFWGTQSRNWQIMKKVSIVGVKFVKKNKNSNKTKIKKKTPMIVNNWALLKGKYYFTST